ncbi:Helicase associated domain protein [Micromonospora sp. NPDC049662]|uniref:DEAD/DEAH box helicase n=1 Tax=Micromonospora sp. NPDC049662 TaxID=3155397 RepID=UPI003417DFD9
MTDQTQPSSQGERGAGPLHPRPQQVEALAALTRAFVVHDRAQLVMACGTGKTLVGRWYAETAQAQTTVVFLPSLSLLAQTLAEWRRIHGWPFEALVVCSDPSTAAGAAERLNQQGEIEDVDRPYWSKVRAKVTTSSFVASGFLSRTGSGRPRVIFSTYHSAPVVAAAQVSSQVPIDLAICDEAHRLTGRPREEFRTVLDRRMLVARKRLFMTATATVVEGDGVYSMDDPKVFGPVAHSVSFGQAIEAGLLTDYRVLVIAGRDGDGVFDQRGPGTVPGALLDAVDQYGIRRLLTFHSRNAWASQFAELLDAVKTPGGRFLRAKHTNGQMPTSKRAEMMQWLGSDAGQVRLISSARCLQEGVDVPAVDGIMFADARNSVTDIIQIVGRVLRSAPGKTFGYVIIPVTLPADGDDDTNLALSSFAQVWAVLKGLREHDSRLGDDLDRAARTVVNGRMYAGRGSDRVQFILPDGVEEAPLQLRFVQEVGSAWERFYLATKDWAAEHPGKRLARNTSHLGAGIGEWAFKQRLARKHGRLSVDRIARLERIPGWYWDREMTDWYDTYAVLKALADRTGGVADNDQGESIFEGLRSVGSPQRRLGVWAAVQRQSFRVGTLDAERVALLEKLPGWSWNGGLADQHVAMIDALAQFCAFEDHASPAEDHVEDGLHLGKWCWAIRRDRLLGKLPPALVDEISAATPRGPKGAETWAWEHNETQWRLMYAALRQFARREGHPLAPSVHKEEFAGTLLGLGQWVSLQRFRYRRGDLDGRYVAWLEALDGWQWEVELATVEYGEPLDLGGHRHGTAKGIAAGCTCKDCLDERRARDRMYLARKRELTDPVRANRAVAHVAMLETQGAKRTAIVTASGVPLGVIRKIMSAEWVKLERDHETAILALSIGDCQSLDNRVGSRGRLVTTANERIDATPTWDILDDLGRRGFGVHWVARELGYTNGMQLRRDVVSRRIADRVQALAARVGDLTYPRVGNQPVPPLAELLRARAGAAVA